MAISSGEPIGQVDSVDGFVTVFREDGSEAQLNQGDAIYLNDQVFTDGPSSAVISLLDGNTLDIAPDSSVFIDEYVYSAGSQDAGASQVAATSSAPAAANVTSAATLYGEPAGTVENMQGSVVVVHVDGAEESLSRGDFVYQDDEVFTSEDSAVAIRFTDETSFSIGADSNLVVDEYVYDSASGDGAVNVSVLKGMFVFVSGLVADKTPQNMSIKTPTATVGIRGTEGMGKIGDAGEESYFVNADGIITINTPTGTVVIDEINETAVVLSPALPPQMAKAWTSAQVIETFVSALRVAPLSVTQRVVNADLSLGTDARSVLSRAIKTMKAKQVQDKAAQERGEQEDGARGDGYGSGEAEEKAPPEQEGTPKEGGEDESGQDDAPPEKSEKKPEDTGTNDEDQPKKELVDHGDDPVIMAVVIDFSEESSQPKEPEGVERELASLLAGKEPPPPLPPQLRDDAAETLVKDDQVEEVENLAPQEPEPEPVTTFDVVGLAVDSYIANATVFFDANNNGVLDSGELSTTTDAEGNYTLALPDGASGSIVILAGGTDIATGETVAVNLSSPVNASLAGAGTLVVSPLSSLVNSLIQSGQTAEQAQATAAQIAGVPNDGRLLTTDPVAATLAGDTNGLALLQANVAVHALVALGASAMAGASNGSVSVAAASQALFAAIASNPSALSSGSSAEITALLAQASSATGAGLGSADGEALGGLLSTVLSAADVTGNDGLPDSTAQLVRLAQISDLVQNQLAADIEQSFAAGNFQQVFESELLTGSIDDRIASIQANDLGVLDPNNANEEIIVSTADLNLSPQAGADAAAVVEESSIAVSAALGLLSNDVDGNNDTLVVSAIRTGAETSSGTAGAVGSSLTGSFGVLTVATDGSYSYVTDPQATNSLAAGQTVSEVFTYTVSDPRGAFDRAELVITISGTNDGPVIVADTGTVAEDATLLVNAAEGVLANDSDVDGDTLAVTTVSTINAGVVQSAQASEPLIAVHGTLTLAADGSYRYVADQAITDTLQEGESITDTFTYTVSDSNGGTGSASLVITVTGTNDAPVASADSGAVLEDDSLAVDAISGVIQSNDVDIDSTSLTVSAVRTGTETGAGGAGTVGSSLTGTLGTLVLAADGSYTYAADQFAADQLAAGQTATDTFTYTVTDDKGATDTAELVITVTGVNDAPRAGDRIFTIDEDTAIAGTENLFDDAGDVEGSITINTTPIVDANHGQLTISGDGSFEYIPDPNFNGSDSFVYEVIDEAGATATGTVTININSINNAPVAAADNFSIDEDGSLADTVTSNDSDADGDVITVSLITDVSSGSLTLGSDGAFTYVPNADFNGSDSFTYELSDGNGGVATATVSITVNPVNDAPIAVGEDFTTDEDVPFSAALLGNDVDIDGDVLSAGLVSDVVNGSLSLNSDGTFTYTPNADFSGSDSFTYEISDGNGGIDSATVSLTINPVNDAPLAADDVYFLAEDNVLEASLALDSVLANDSDLEGDLLTVNTVPVLAPLNGSLSLNSDGTFTYTPDENFNGSDSFVYEVTDGSAVSIATATILIDPVNDAPELAGISLLGDYSEAPPLGFDNVAPMLGFAVSDDGQTAASVGHRNGDDFLNVFTLNPMTGQFEFFADLKLGPNVNASAPSVVAITEGDPLTIQVFTRDVDRFDIILFDPNAAVPLQDATAAIFGQDLPFSLIEAGQPVIGPNGETVLSFFSHGQVSNSAPDAGVVVSAFGDGNEITILVNVDGQVSVANTITPENTPEFIGSDSLALLFFGELLYVTQDDTADIQVFARGEFNSYSFVTTLVAGVDLPEMGSEQLLQRSPDDNQLYVVEQSTAFGQPAVLHIFDIIAFGDGEQPEGPLQLVASLPIFDENGGAVETVGQVFARDLDTVIAVADDGRLIAFENPVDRLPLVDEDTTAASLNSTSGALVADFLDASDVDGDVLGIAVEEFVGKGDWYFSLDSGLTWQIIDQASLDSETDELVFLLGADARVFYEPAPDESGSDVGRLYYSAWDGSDGTNGTVYVVPAFGTALSNTVRILHADINPVNDQATGVDDVFSVGVDGALVRNVTHNDFDVDGDDFSVDTTPVSDASNGTLILNSDGSFLYTPNTGFVGTDSFEYAVTDGISSQVSTAVVTINVTHTPTLTPENLTFDYDITSFNPFDVAAAPSGTTLSADGKFAVSVGHSAGNDVINFYVLDELSGEFVFDSSAIVGPSFNPNAPIYTSIDELGGGSYLVNVFSHDQDRLVRFEVSEGIETLDVTLLNSGISFSNLFAPINNGGNFFDLFAFDQTTSAALRDDGSRTLAFANGSEIKLIDVIPDGNGGRSFNFVQVLFEASDSIALGLDGNILYVTRDDTPDITVINEIDGAGYVVVTTLSAGIELPVMGTEQLLQRSPDGSQLYVVEQSQTTGTAAQMHIFDIIVGSDGSIDGLLRHVDSFALLDGLGNPIEAVAQVVVQEQGDVLVVSELDGAIVSFTRQVERLLPVDEDSGAPLDGITVGTTVASFLAANDIDGDPLGIAVGSLNGAGNWYFSIDGGATWQIIDRNVFDVEVDSVLLLLDGSSQLYYEPAPDESGEDLASLAYTVWDGNEGELGTFHTVVEFGNGAFGDTVGTLHATVNAVNDDVVAQDDLFFVEPNTSLNGSVALNDFDADGDALFVNPTPLTDVSNGSLSLNSDGSFSYFPNPGFVGNDSFEYEVSDGISSFASTAVVTIQVNTPPELTPEDLSVAYTVNAEVPSSAPGFPAGATVSQDGKYLVATGHDAGNDFAHFYVLNETTNQFEFDSTALIGPSTNVDAPVYVVVRNIEPNVYETLIFNKDQDRLTRFEFSDTGAGLDVSLLAAAVPYSFVSIPMTDGGNLADFFDREQTASSAPASEGIVRLGYGDGFQIHVIEAEFGVFSPVTVLQAGVTPGFSGSDSFAFGLDGHVLYVVNDLSADIQIYNDGAGGFALVDTVVAGVDAPPMGPLQQLSRSPDGTQLYVVSESGITGEPSVLHIFDIAVSTAGELEGGLRFAQSIDLIDSNGVAIEAVAQIIVQELDNVLIVDDNDGRVVSFNTQVDRLLPVDEDSGAPVDGVTLGTDVASFLRASDADGDTVGIAVGEASGAGNWHFSTDGGATWQLIDNARLSQQGQNDLLLLAADSRIYYEPAPEESGDRLGSLAYVAWDGREGTVGTIHSVPAFGAGAFGETVSHVHATVTAVNDLPEAVDDNFIVGVDNVLEASVVANDFDIDSPLSISTTPLVDVANGSLTLNSDGTFTYVPNVGFAGIDSFEYVLSDGIDSATATVTIDVDNTPQLTPEELVFAYSVAPGSSFDAAGAPGGAAISDDGLYAVSVGHSAGDDVINFYIFNELSQQFEFDVSQIIGPSADIDAPIYVGISSLGGGEYRVDVFNRTQDSFSRFEFSESLGLDVTAKFIGLSFSQLSSPIINGGDFFDLLGSSHSAGSIADNGVVRLAFATSSAIDILERLPNGQFVFLQQIETGVTPGFTGSDSIAFALEGYTLYVTKNDSPDIQIYEDVDNGYQLVDTLVAGVDIPLMGPEQYLQRSPDGTQLYVVEQSSVLGQPATLHIFDIIIATGDVNGEGQLRFVQSIDIVDGNGVAVEAVSQVVVLELDYVLAVAADDGRIISLDRPVERTLAVDEDSGAPVSGTLGTVVSSFLIATDADAADTLGIAVGYADGAGLWYFSLDDGLSWQHLDPSVFDTSDDEAMLLLGPNAQLYYQPAPNEHGDNAGEIRYTVWDGRVGVEGELVNVGAFGNGAFGDTVDVLHAEVTSVNDTPVAVFDGFTIDENSVLEADVLANDFDVDQDVLSVSLAAGGDVINGSLSLNADGTFTYTPNADFFGSDSFVYEVSDGNGGVATATVAINVDEFNAAPEIIGPSLNLKSTAAGLGFTAPAQPNATAFSGDGRFAISAGHVSGTDHINVYQLNDLTGEYDFIFSDPVGTNIAPGEPLYTVVSDRIGGGYDIQVFSAANDLIRTYRLDEGLSTPSLSFVSDESFSSLPQGPIDGAGTVFGDLFSYSHSAVSPLIDGTEFVVGFGDGNEIIIRDGFDAAATTRAIIDSSVANFTGSSSFAFFEFGELIFVAPPVNQGSEDILLFIDNGAGYQFSARLVGGVDIPSMGADKLLQASADGNQLYVVQQGDVGVAAVMHIFDITEAAYSDTANPAEALRLSESIILIDNNGNAIEQVAQVVASSSVQNTVAIIADDGRFVSFDHDVPRLAPIDEDAGTPIDGVTVGTAVSSFLAATDAEGDTIGIAVWGVSGSGNWYFSLDDGASWQFIDRSSFSTPSEDFLLTLEPTTRIFYEPGEDEHGDAAAGLFYVAWDINGPVGLNGQFVTDEFGFGGGTEFGDVGATAYVDINPIDDAPIAVDDSFDAVLDTPLFGDVLVNDEAEDVDGDALELITTPLVDVSNGSLVLSSDGTFSYTPNTGFLGFDSFTYEVSDGGSFTSTATVSINVGLANVPPVINTLSTSVSVADIDPVGALFQFDGVNDLLFDPELSSIGANGDYTGASIFIDVVPGDGTVAFFDSGSAFGTSGTLLVENGGTTISESGATIATISSIAEDFQIEFIDDFGQFADQTDVNDIVASIDFTLTNAAGASVDVFPSDGNISSSITIDIAQVATV